MVNNHSVQQGSLREGVHGCDREIRARVGS